jgi:Glycosyltransferase
MNYNLYCSTSTSDAGIAASTSEAMSSGLIPIIADNSENDFWVSHNSGFLFKTSSAEDLANIISEFFFLSKEKKHEMSINARNKILNYNSYDNEMNKMLQLYNELYNEKN